MMDKKIMVTNLTTMMPDIYSLMVVVASCSTECHTLAPVMPRCVFLTFLSDNVYVCTKWWCHNHDFTYQWWCLFRGRLDRRRWTRGRRGKRAHRYGLGVMWILDVDKHQPITGAHQNLGTYWQRIRVEFDKYNIYHPSDKLAMNRNDSAMPPVEPHTRCVQQIPWVLW